MPDVERNYYVLCDDNCRFPGMTYEQIIAAIAEATGNVPEDVDDAFITKIKESNHNANLTFWKGTQAEFNALGVEADAYQVVVDGSGKVYLKQGEVEILITTSKIADGAVTGAKIADSAVTTAKIANGAVNASKIADSAVTTAKVASGIESSKLVITAADIYNSVSDLPTPTGSRRIYFVKSGS